MSEHREYELTKADARADWRQLATEVAQGASPPPESTLQAILAAAGGGPEHTTARAALRATASVYKSLGVLPDERRTY